MTHAARNITLSAAPYASSLLEGAARILGIGTAVPERSYTQEEFCRLFGVRNLVVHRLIKAGHIAKRHLYLPKADPATGVVAEETQEELIEKFRHGVLDIGVRAAREALRSAGLRPEHVDYLVCVTSSGFAVPGVSSVVSRVLGMRANLHRNDVVGMGCNAGMSALYPTASWAKANPGKTALLLCCEVNSANYVRDESVRTGIVNSLFGDGAAAIVLRSGSIPAGQPGFGNGGGEARRLALSLVDFESITMQDQEAAMRFDWDKEKRKWSFFLSKDIPFVIGENMNKPVDALLGRHGLDRGDIRHWVLHTGGGAVIDGACRSLGLDEYDVRHTRSVLRDYGNLSSGSFLFSLERLREEGSLSPGDKAVLIAMGPGSTIEAGLAVWE